MPALAPSARVMVNGSSNMWFTVVPGKLILGRYIANKTCGVYLRGPMGGDIDDTTALLEPHQKTIESRLEVEMGPENDWFAMKTEPYPVSDKVHWPDAIDFLETNTKSYLALMKEIFRGEME